MIGKKILENGKRSAMLLSNDSFRVVIDFDKGMIPELSLKRGNAWINAHWNPWFRANSGESWNSAKHADFWKVPLLYDIAGNFPCAPNFGPDHEYRGCELPPHGFTAAEEWTPGDSGPAVSEDSVSFRTKLAPSAHPLNYEKIDLVAKGQNTHYTAMNISNGGETPEEYNAAWHNTVGSPFLECGCLIDNSAVAFAVPPKGGEFDSTGRLAFGAEADSLTRVPLREGGNVNIRTVPGIIGYTDFITGAVPADCSLAWSTVVNPHQKLVYLSFGAGPAGSGNDEIPIYFHDLWMNYGGRDYEPWATADGQTDMTFCLGAENGTGFFANGLAASVEHPKLLGNPTHLVLNPGEQKKFYYATSLESYEGDCLDGGVKEVATEDDALVLVGYTGKSLRIKADWQFQRLRALL